MSLRCLERVGLCAVVGPGVITIGVFLSDLLWLRISRFSVLLSILLAGAVLWVFLKKLPLSNAVNHDKDKSWGIIATWLLIWIALLVVLNAIQNSYWPINTYDAVSTYDTKAKLVLQQETVLLKEYQRPLPPNWYYPPFVHLGLAALYLLGVSSGKILMTILYAGLCILVYVNFRRFIARRTALLWTLFIASIPYLFNSSIVATTNFPASVYVTLGAIYLIAWLKTSDPGHAVISGLLFGLAGWVRTDSVVFLAAILVGAMLIRPLTWRRSGSLFWIGLLGLAPFVTWQITLKLVACCPKVLPEPAFPPVWAYMGYLLRGMWVMLLTPQKFSIVAPLFLLATLFSFRTRDIENRVVLIGWLFLAAWYACFVAIGPGFDLWKLTVYDSGERLLLSVVPVLVFTAGVQTTIRRWAEFVLAKVESFF